MSEEGCIGSPFQFLVARVMAGGWLCREDNMFPLFPVSLQFQKVSLQELEMYAERWLPRQMLHTGSKELPNVPGSSLVAGPALGASMPHLLSWQGNSCRLPERGSQTQP